MNATDTSPMLPEELSDHPPAAKLVWLALDACGEADAQTLVDVTTLSEGSVYERLQDLHDAGLVTYRIDVESTTRKLWRTNLNP